MVQRSGIEGAEHQIPKMERRCGVRNSPPDGAEVRCAQHQIRVRCPALTASNIHVLRTLRQVNSLKCTRQILRKQVTIEIANVTARSGSNKN